MEKRHLHRRTRRGAEGAAAPPRAWKISGQTLFSGQPQVAQKPWIIKYISVQWKIPGQLFFMASPSCSKILNKKNTFNIVNSGHLLFLSEQAQVVQNSWIIIYIRYTKFREPSVFQGKRKLLKISECKEHIPYSKKFQGNSVFQDKR